LRRARARVRQDAHELAWSADELDFDVVEAAGELAQPVFVEALLEHPSVYVRHRSCDTPEDRPPARRPVPHGLGDDHLAARAAKHRLDEEPFAGDELVEAGEDADDVRVLRDLLRPPVPRADVQAAATTRLNEARVELEAQVATVPLEEQRRDRGVAAAEVDHARSRLDHLGDDAQVLCRGRIQDPHRPAVHRRAPVNEADRDPVCTAGAHRRRSYAWHR